MQSNPIIPWLGGKRRLADKIFPLFPKHECYVEPFTGGGALFFLRAVPARVEVLNDINGDLVSLYRVVQNHLDEFVRQFQWSLTSRQMFDWLKRADTSGLTDIQRAARFFYLQHTAFGARVESQTFGTATTTPGFNLQRIEESLSAAHHRLAGVTIEHLPWSDVLERYDRPHTFFYCDPPYWQTEGYGVPFEWAQYEKLASMMRNAQGKVMVSINDHPDIRKAFEGFSMLELEIAYSVSGGTKPREKFGELVIANWDLEQSGGLF